ncbi:unnamed protein product [Prunus armeniaca]
MIPALSSSWGRKGESRCGVFPLLEISLHTHALPTNADVRGQNGEATFYPNIILVFSRARAPTARTQQAGLSQGQAAWDYLCVDFVFTS